MTAQTVQEMIMAAMKGMLRPIQERFVAIESRLESVGNRASGVADAGIVARMDQHIQSLERRLQAVEENPPNKLRYQGTWNDERAYNVDDAVSHGDGLWFCRKSCRGVRPGDDGTQWTLAVRRARERVRWEKP